MERRIYLILPLGEQPLCHAKGLRFRIFIEPFDNFNSHSGIHIKFSFLRNLQALHLH